MTQPEYVSLHVHSHNSLLDGFSTIDGYLDRVEELGQRGIGLTDHGNLFGVFEFLKKSQSRGVVGIPGCEFYVAPENPQGAEAKERIFYGEPGQKYDVSSQGAYLHMTVWAYNQVGLHNLFRLSSLSNAPERFYQKPRIDFNLLAQYSEGLIVATGCPSSEISTRFLLGQDKKAYEYASRLIDVFGKDRVFVEIMDHSMEEDLERILLPKQVKLSRDLGLGLLATNDSHYSHKEDSIHHEEMLAKQSKSFMSMKTYDEGGRRFAFSGNDYYHKSAAEMAKIFPEAEYPNALRNSLVIADMVEDVNLKYNPHLKPVPETPPGMSEAEFFKSLLREGLKKRYGDASPEVKREAAKRVREEFDLFYSSDFIGYMLVVREYMVWTRENFSTRSSAGDILALSVGSGRGSVGGSIVAFLLDISEIDPIRYDLLSERFLSPGRGAQYVITYKDGSKETVVASDSYDVSDGTTKYTHQLEVGDKVMRSC